MAFIMCRLIVCLINGVGKKYEHLSYRKEIHDDYPWIASTIPYKEPLWADVTIDDEQMKISGRSTEFVGPSPEELGIPNDAYAYPIVSQISNRKLNWR